MMNNESWKDLFSDYNVLFNKEEITTRQSLNDICFNIPIEWEKVSSEDQTLYWLPEDNSGSVTVQCVTPKSTDYSGMTNADVLSLFAEGLCDELDNYSPVWKGECWSEINNTTAFGFIYEITVEDKHSDSLTVLFLVQGNIYCITFSCCEADTVLKSFYTIISTITFAK
ncbi:MAG: hypothetical protein IJZ64_01530 [Ruminococcus sp.]|nr:hypothetical protein [Ruminococcus sp.]